MHTFYHTTGVNIQAWDDSYRQRHASLPVWLCFTTFQTTYRPLHGKQSFLEYENYHYMRSAKQAHSSPNRERIASGTIPIA
ncbi:hypothetical protein HMPREF1587_01179 [Bifidobacterium breve JCP7499]|nr:hypothetical protein HMPREF1587_01179 [Bifidobacterium breve JCP7499]